MSGFWVELAVDTFVGAPVESLGKVLVVAVEEHCRSRSTTGCG